MHGQQESAFTNVPNPVLQNGKFYYSHYSLSYDSMEDGNNRRPPQHRLFGNIHLVLSIDFLLKGRLLPKNVKKKFKCVLLDYN